MVPKDFFRTVLLHLFVLLGVLSTGASIAADEKKEAETLLDAITGGKPLLNLRPRYEYVDQANKPEHADAFTLRTLVGWETKPYKGFGITLQAINVAHITDDFNDDPTKAAASKLSPAVLKVLPDPTSAKVAINNDDWWADNYQKVALRFKEWLLVG